MSKENCELECGAFGTYCKCNDEAKASSCNNDLLCADCKKTFDVPFDNGDGKVRCAGCATDYYMQHPLARVVVKRHGIIDFNCGA